jgi:hypothetical protein
MGAKGCNFADWSAAGRLSVGMGDDGGDAGLRSDPKSNARRADEALWLPAFDEPGRRGARALGWGEWMEATRLAAQQDFKGGRWTEDQYGGVMDDAGVCLDACGWGDACMDCSTRRRTGSDPLLPAQSAVAENFYPQFAPRGFRAVGGTKSAGRRSPDLSGCACEFPPGMTRPVPRLAGRKILVGGGVGAQAAPHDDRDQVRCAVGSRCETESPVVQPIREGAGSTVD